jgi:hypothetical protein
LLSTLLAALYGWDLAPYPQIQMQNPFVSAMSHLGMWMEAWDATVAAMMAVI